MVECGAWTATIAENAFEDIGIVGAAEDGKNVLRDVRAKGGNEQRDAVENGIFTLTFVMRTLENTFENIGGFFAKNAADCEG